MQENRDGKTPAVTIERTCFSELKASEGTFLKPRRGRTTSPIRRSGEKYGDYRVPRPRMRCNVRVNTLKPPLITGFSPPIREFHHSDRFYRNLPHDYSARAMYSTVVALPVLWLL